MAVAWTDTTSGVTVKEITPNSGVKIIIVRTPATFSTTTNDTMAVDLTKFGAYYCAGVLGFQETTVGSITTQMGVTAAGGLSGFTTAVVTGTLTITTVAPASGACVHSFIIFAY
jgi:hypothetical protein